MNYKSKFLIFTATVTGLIIIWLFVAARTDSQNLELQVENSDATIANYKRFCAGCHGMYMERFSGNDREKLFGTPEQEIIRVIAYGELEAGMPAFKETFSEEEIGNLAHYILTDIKEAVNRGDYRPVLQSIQKSEKLSFILDTFATGLEIPWGMAWLPDGDMLVTERAGHLNRYRNGIFVTSIEGLPEFYALGQGGLLDIRLHPQYNTNGWIYLSYSAPGAGGQAAGGNTAIMRGRLKENRLVDQQVLFKATLDSRSGVHFGSRMVFGNDGHLYFSVGDRGHMQNAQMLNNHSGKIHRITDDGKIPPDNPFVNTPGAMPSIYSFGHRNPQGLVKHPETGVIWSHEHGPRGGDEINIIRKGLNYGWPVITYGINYDGTTITPYTAKAVWNSLCITGPLP